MSVDYRSTVFLPQTGFPMKGELPVQEPRLLVLDEPTAGMSTEESARTASIIRNLNGQNVTIVVIEHDMSLVMKICDQITVLSFGRKLAGGTPQEVRRNPEVIKAYLGSGERGA